MCDDCIDVFEKQKMEIENAPVGTEVRYDCPKCGERAVTKLVRIHSVPADAGSDRIRSRLLREFLSAMVFGFSVLIFWFAVKVVFG